MADGDNSPNRFPVPGVHSLSGTLFTRNSSDNGGIEMTNKNLAVVIAVLLFYIVTFSILVRCSPPRPQYTTPMKKILKFSYDYRYIYEGDPVIGYVSIDKDFSSLNGWQLWRHTKTWPLEIKQLTFAGSQIAGKILDEGIFIISGKGDKIVVAYRKYAEEEQLRKYFEQNLKDRRR